MAHLPTSRNNCNKSFISCASHHRVQRVSLTLKVVNFFDKSILRRVEVLLSGASASQTHLPAFCNHGFWKIPREYRNWAHTQNKWKQGILSSSLCCWDFPFSQLYYILEDQKLMLVVLHFVQRSKNCNKKFVKAVIYFQIQVIFLPKCWWVEQLTEWAQVFVSKPLPTTMLSINFTTLDLFLLKE